MINKKSIFYTLLLYLSVSCTIFSSNTLSSKVLIWDLGRTLFKPHHWGILKEIGFSDFILYPLFNGKSPHHIETITFTLLRALTCPHSPLMHYNLAPATDKGIVLPLAFRGWLAGYQSSCEILQQAYYKIEEFNRSGYFRSSREKRLVTRTLEFMFNPSKFAHYMRPINPAVNIVRECFNTGEHQMFILSNWDSESFSHLYNSYHGQKVFQYFEPENIIISGDINIIKPDPQAFEYILKKYAIKPQDCILIDDELINIDVARKLGITAVHLEKDNYTKLRLQLKCLKVI